MTGVAEHARSYPFPILGRSYLFRDGAAHPLPAGGFDRGGRWPVLGAGSNQSHEQIARKFAATPGEIPVQRATLHGFDVVYAAQLARYGSVPATFCPSPGTAVSTCVLWLDALRLARMHETELAYSFDRLDGVRVELDGAGEALSTAYVYTAGAGCLDVGGGPAALAEIAAAGRTFPALTQTEILTHVRDRLEPGADLDAFIVGHVADDDLRRRRRAALEADAVRPDFPRTVVTAP